jgi:hypothetical protein
MCLAVCLVLPGAPFISRVMRAVGPMSCLQCHYVSRLQCNKVYCIVSFLCLDEADFCYQNYIMDILKGTIGWMLLHEFVSTQTSIECSFR